MQNTEKVMNKLEDIENQLKLLQNKTPVPVEEPNIMGLIGITILMLFGLTILLWFVEAIRERRSSTKRGIRQSLKSGFFQSFFPLGIIMVYVAMVFYIDKIGSVSHTTYLTIGIFITGIGLSLSLNIEQGRYSERRHNEILNAIKREVSEVDSLKKIQNNINSLINQKNNPNQIQNELRNVQSKLKAIIKNLEK